MKIVVGSIQQETNTLNPIPTRYDDFDVYLDKDMLKHISISDYLYNSGIDVIPTIYASAVPGGILKKSDFVYLSDELLSRIPDEGIDGIWLYLHGAMHVEGIGSGETTILDNIRKKVGFKIPISLALDFHANNTEKLMKLANIICGYRTAPHRDMSETEIRSAKLLIYCIENGILPRPQMARSNVVVPGDCVITDNEPLLSIMLEAYRMESEEGMLAVNIFNGQPWVDSENMGPSMVAIHASDDGKAEKAAKKLADMFYKARYDFKFTVEAYEPVKALEQALAGNEERICVTDSGDNPSAGATADNAYMLRLLMENEVKNSLLGGITDKSAVDICHSTAVGNDVNLSLGGLLIETSERIRLTGTLLYKGDILGWKGGNGGRAAVIRNRGTDIIITENSCVFSKPEIFSSVNVDIKKYHITVLKMGYLFPELEDIFDRTIIALTKGSSTEYLQEMGHKNIRRPMFPLDDNFI